MKLILIKNSGEKNPREAVCLQLILKHAAAQTKQMHHAAFESTVVF